MRFTLSHIVTLFFFFRKYKENIFTGIMQVELEKGTTFQNAYYKGSICKKNADYFFCEPKNKKINAKKKTNYCQQKQVRKSHTKTKLDKYKYGATWNFLEANT